MNPFEKDWRAMNGLPVQETAVPKTTGAAAAYNQSRTAWLATRERIRALSEELARLQVEDQRLRAKCAETRAVAWEEFLKTTGVAPDEEV